MTDKIVHFGAALLAMTLLLGLAPSRTEAAPAYRSEALVQTVQYYAPGYYAPRYYRPRYYAPRYYGPRYYRPRYYVRPPYYGPRRYYYRRHYWRPF